MQKSKWMCSLNGIVIFNNSLNLSNVGGFLWCSYQTRWKNLLRLGSHYCCHGNCVNLHFLMPTVRNINANLNINNVNLLP